ncbi:MAG: hypothetical protein WAM79_14115 [Candidatus Sulfotelmatobacter sp.]
MSRENVVCLAGRVLALLFTVFTLCELSYLPEYVQSFLHYADYEIGPTTNIQYLQYWRHHVLVALGFLVARIVGFALVSGWFFKGGPDVAELLLPAAVRSSVVES